MRTPTSQGSRCHVQELAPEPCTNVRLMHGGGLQTPCRARTGTCSLSVALQHELETSRGQQKKSQPSRSSKLLMSV